ncbi:hypothetical protein SAMN02745704_01472 [Paucidesulfovibrio gracilis DSM 16080]|uniref:VPLPA-CTERM protein sorting domain-containing protein n=1 Tax=Paucidesulfovibrio gracilis DSM 16080 TaxID=1121449 RepID=A0A1T4WX51_9BACT|nr:VPLPA-CTERM sorting domain-containing protein [Paucidesulfovibrio gracilis]SKA81933.1 hypothetical protein SAMN02745704_01472 [Paucidesulfovibrio gracilis DSM 16080]
MKRHILFLTIAFLLTMTTTTLAVPFNITYTADNSLRNFSYSVDGGVLQSVPGFVDEGSSGDWTTPQSLSFDMAVGSTYQFVWQVDNTGAVGADDNPMAFLAEISNAWGTVETSSIWEVANNNGGTPGTWGAATEYALNSGAWLTGESGNSIWFKGNGNSGVAGISDSARWIGLDEYPGPTGQESMFVRLSLTTPTPLPAAVWMFGAGLAGLLGMGRWRRRS